MALNSSRGLVGWLQGIIGALLGGVIGYVVFAWILRQGFYALALPGALVGAGCGLLSRRPSMVRGIFCAATAIGLGLFAEWRHFPFRVDESLGYFATHVHELKPVTLVLIGLGAVLAFWFGKGTLTGATSERTPPPSP